MQIADATPPVNRLVALAPAGPATAAAVESRFDTVFGGPEHDPQFDESRDAIDRFPAWLAAGIIVGLSGVFWVGILTILGWVV